VEGTLIHGMPAAFAGFRSNVGLGRSVSSVRGSFPCKRSHRRQQVPSGRRGGERRQHAPPKRTHPTQGTSYRDLRTGTRPSLGPSTRARQSSLCSAGASLGGGGFEVASRSGKPVQTGVTGTGAVSSGRSAARHVSPLPQGRGRDTSRKGRRSRPPSLRGS